jgi:iron(III) transport system substrate-binding protein
MRLLLLLLALVWAGTLTAQEVNIYSYRQEFLIKPFLEKFTESTGIQVNVVYAQSGLTERLQREGRNSPADLLLTSNFARLIEAKVAGVTQAVQSAELNRNIPATYRDTEGHWFGLTRRARLIYASQERVGQVPISYESLAEPLWKGRICTRSGKHDYNIALIASIIAHHGSEAAEQWLTGVKNNLARRPQGNDRAQVKAIFEGQCDLSLGNSYYYGAMLANDEQKAWANSVNLLFPNQGERGTHVNISGVALTKHAPHRDAAIRLMEFLSQETAQRMYAEVNYEFPVREGVAVAGILKPYQDFQDDELPLADYVKYRKEAAMLVDRVGFDQ